MNARELLAEVQRTPAYVGKNPSYDVIVRLIQDNRQSLSLTISEIFTIENPFDTIDQAVETAQKTLPHVPDMTVSEHFKSIYKSVQFTLNYCIGDERDRITRSSELMQRLKSKQYDNVIAQQIANLEARALRSTELITEAQALRELIELYTIGVLTLKDMKHLFE